jgi:predicted restriction endonuclease
VLSAGPDAPPGGVGKHARYVPVTVRRAVHIRDTGQCSFVSADGRRCSARAFLELDHRKPFARHGAPDARNIRLLCRAHNLLHARNCFGMLHVAAKIAASKRCRSTTIEDG